MSRSCVPVRNQMTTERSRNLDPDGGLELLWGARERPSGGARPGLSVDRIVRAAVEVADTGGLGAVSMRRVAERLGFAAMSLYRYVPGKSALIELMLDAAIGTPSNTGLVPGDWRAKLELWSRKVLAVYQRHPWVLDVPLSGSPLGPNRIAWLEAGLDAITGIGLGGREAVSALLLVDGHARSAAQVSARMAQARRLNGLSTGQAFARILQSAVADGPYPTLSSLVASGAFEETGKSPEVDFEFGLQRVLDGMEALIQRRSVELRHP